MKDTHELFGILRSFSVGRLQALRLLGPEFAHPVDRLALRTLLTQATEAALPIMIFVGSRGVIQIHTGPVRNLRQYGDWFNVMDPGFNLHLHEPGIDTAWVVKKPTADGLVSSLELYDEQGDVLLMTFSKRKHGQTESAAWRAMLARLPALPTQLDARVACAGGAA
jgi:putative hemin transport protein